MTTAGQLIERMNGEEEMEYVLTSAITDFLPNWVNDREFNVCELKKIRKNIGFSGKYPEKQVGAVLDEVINAAQPA
jgi:hypothetical protein